MKLVSYGCIDRQHLIARCPLCGKGATMVTCKKDFNGIEEAKCSECNKSVAFYVLMDENKAWMLGTPLQMDTRKVT